MAAADGGCRGRRGGTCGADRVLHRLPGHLDRPAPARHLTERPATVAAAPRRVSPPRHETVYPRVVRREQEPSMKHHLDQPVWPTRTIQEHRQQTSPPNPTMGEIVAGDSAGATCCAARSPSPPSARPRRRSPSRPPEQARAQGATLTPSFNFERVASSDETLRRGGLRRRRADPLGRPGAGRRARLRPAEADGRRAGEAVRLQQRAPRLHAPLLGRRHPTTACSS